MTILLILIPISFIFLLLAIGIFIWAMRNNQFENLESAALDILTTETEVASQSKTDDDKNNAD